VLICKFTEAGRKQRAVMSPSSLIRSVIKCYGQFFSQQLVHRGHCHTPTDSDRASAASLVKVNQNNDSTPFLIRCQNVCVLDCAQYVRSITYARHSSQLPMSGPWSGCMATALGWRLESMAQSYVFSVSDLTVDDLEGRTGLFG
jgi:hypothetical protein